jgi:hypothetical protein
VVKRGLEGDSPRKPRMEFDCGALEDADDVAKENASAHSYRKYVCSIVSYRILNNPSKYCN